MENTEDPKKKKILNQKNIHLLCSTAETLTDKTPNCKLSHFELQSNKTFNSTSISKLFSPFKETSTNRYNQPIGIMVSVCQCFRRLGFNLRSIHIKD